MCRDIPLLIPLDLGGCFSHVHEEELIPSRDWRKNMTSEEKKQITQLRKRGCTYQEISQETGLAL